MSNINQGEQSHFTKDERDSENMARRATEQDLHVTRNVQIKESERKELQTSVGGRNINELEEPELTAGKTCTCGCNPCTCKHCDCPDK